MSILNIGGLTKYYGAEFIFGNIGFQITRGDKVALVGANGAGKSTLLKIIAGIEPATSGGVHLARGTRVAYLAQEARFDGDQTLLEEMRTALAYLTTLQHEMNALEHALADTGAPGWEAQMERYGELAHRFEHAGGYEIERRIERILQGLGFTEAQYHQPLVQFSGGQKTRAALAAALLSDPDLLLLDEPTNHLDLAALEWLERFLKGWEGTLMVISHDRYFLDKVTNRTLDMAFGTVEDYPAGYNRYLALKAERMELRLKQYQAQQEQIARTEEFIRRFKSNQRSKEARGRERRLERLKTGWERVDGTIERLLDRPQDQKKLRLSLNTQIRSGDLVLALEGLAVGYPSSQQPAASSQQPAAKETGRQGDRETRGQGEHSRIQNPKSKIPHLLLHCPDLEIHRGQRVALIGPNGSGKTTLLRTIVGELAPLGGRVRLGHRVVLNYYAQAHEGLRLDATILNEIWRVAPQIKEVEARTLLGRFLFSGDDVFKHVGDLSGGERSRVALAQLTLMAGNLLVLDEPTNHLDIDAREALESVLNDYHGTILFVSHDRYFIDAVADTIWEVRDGSIASFDGTYSEYAAFRERAEAPPAKHSQEKKPAPGPAAESPLTNGTERKQPAETTRPAGSIRGQSKEERKRQRRLAALEDEISLLERELKQLEEEMTTAGIAGDGKRVAALSMQYAEVQEMVQTRYDEWAAAAG